MSKADKDRLIYRADLPIYWYFCWM